jgi:hypothetical protein
MPTDPDTGQPLTQAVFDLVRQTKEEFGDRPMADDSKLWEAVQKCLAPYQAGLTQDVLADDLLARDRTLQRDGESFGQFQRRLRRVLLEHGLIRGTEDFSDVALGRTVSPGGAGMSLGDWSGSWHDTETGQLVLSPRRQDEVVREMMGGTAAPGAAGDAADGPTAERAREIVDEALTSFGHKPRRRT